MKLFYTVGVLLLLGSSRSARILVIQPTQFKRNVDISYPLIEELAARGHQVTFVTNFPHKPPLPNLREVYISEIHRPIIDFLKLAQINDTWPNPFNVPLRLTYDKESVCQQVLPKLKSESILNTNESYDLVMIESIMLDCYVAFTNKFRAPLITFATSGVLPWESDWMGLPDNPSYIPHYFVDSFPEMSLRERIYNTITLISAKLVYQYHSLSRAQRMVNKYLGNSVPPMDQLLRNTSLMFINSHFSLSVNRPFPPNVVEIGGIHIRESSPQLPKDLQDILDISSEGVILVNIGSFLHTALNHKHQVNKLLNALSTLPQKVIFKYKDTLPDVPHNVIVRKSFPQQQIIGHKHVRLLITDGELSSTMEAVHFGKPTIGVPYFTDQVNNMKAMVRRGAGLILDTHDLTQQKIKDAIKEVLRNVSYTSNAKRLSEQFRDRPMTPLQTAVYWTEYVIRHQGAPHLQPASVHLPLYQYLLLDVIAVLVVFLLVFLYITYFLLFKAVNISPNDPHNYKPNKIE